MAIKTPRLVGFLILMAFIVTLGYLFPFSLVLGKAGLSDPKVASTIDFYLKLLYGGLIGVLIIYLLNYFWKSNNKLGDSVGFFNMGEKPSLSFFKRFTAPQLTILSFIFFGMIFLTANLLNFRGTLTGLKFLSQQFTPLDSLALSTAIIPVAENLLLAFTIGILILVFTFVSLRLKISPKEYSLYIYIIVILGSGLFGIIWHSTVYGSNSVALPIVFIFWSLMGFLAMVTGLWTIPFSVHLLNNFFIDFNRIFASDTILLITVGIILGLFGLIYYIIYHGRLFGEKHNVQIEN